jgi:hypothetical protein
VNAIRVDCAILREMRKCLAVVTVNALIGAEPNVAIPGLQNAPDGIFFRAIIIKRVAGIELASTVRGNGNSSKRFSIVPANSSAGTEPNIARFIFFNRIHRITIQPIFICELDKRFAIVAVHTFARSAEPKVAGPVLQTAMDILELVTALRFYYFRLCVTGRDAHH